MVDVSPALPKATHEGVVSISDASIRCYVLEDGTRVLSQRGINEAFGVTHGGKGDGQNSSKMPRFLATNKIKPFLFNGLAMGRFEPLVFARPKGGKPASGVPALLLPDACEAWLRARDAGVLKSDRSLAIAHKADALMRGFARLGVIGLVDEATGYQQGRPKHALEYFLNSNLRPDAAPWTKRFPDEFYENIYKLKGWEWTGMGKNRRPAVGGITNNIVYRRLGPPPLLKELQVRSPKDDEGQRLHKLHQWLTSDVGAPRLAQHIQSLLTLQRLAISSRCGWSCFMHMVDQLYPLPWTNLDLPFPDHDNLVLTGAHVAMNNDKEVKESA